MDIVAVNSTTIRQLNVWSARLRRLLRRQIARAARRSDQSRHEFGNDWDSRVFVARGRRRVVGGPFELCERGRFVELHD